jgi:hypothetical protein
MTADPDLPFSHGNEGGFFDADQLFCFGTTGDLVTLIGSLMFSALIYLLSPGHQTD